MKLSYEEVLAAFKKDVEHSVLDAARVPSREQNTPKIAREIYNLHYKDVLHESVLDEYRTNGS